MGEMDSPNVRLAHDSPQGRMVLVILLDACLAASLGGVRRRRSWRSQTSVAAMVYYRSRVFSNAWDALIVGILPILACVFLGWILVKSLLSAPASQLWSLVGIVAWAWS